MIRHNLRLLPLNILMVVGGLVWAGCAVTEPAVPAVITPSSTATETEAEFDAWLASSDDRETEEVCDTIDGLAANGASANEMYPYWAKGWDENLTGVSDRYSWSAIREHCGY